MIVGIKSINEGLIRIVNGLATTWSICSYEKTKAERVLKLASSIRLHVYNMLGCKNCCCYWCSPFERMCGLDFKFSCDGIITDITLTWQHDVDKMVGPSDDMMLRWRRWYDPRVAKILWQERWCHEEMWQCWLDDVGSRRTYGCICGLLMWLLQKSN